MNDQEFPTVNSDLLDRIIQLADQRFQSDCGRYPNGIFSGETEILPESRAALDLKQAINEMSCGDARELYALMYLGRDGLENETAAVAIAFSLDQAASCDESDVKNKLFEKTPLATYLRKGLALTAGIRAAEVKNHWKPSN